jgi:CRP-like cAMP-binding protein
VYSSQISRPYPSLRTRNVATSKYRQSDARPSSVRDLDSRLLRGLTESDLKSLLATGTTWTFPGPAVVVRQGEPADRLFLLLKGTGKYFIHTQEGRKLLLIWLAPGEIFGGSALLDQPGDYLCSVEVIGGTQILVWERNRIRDFAARCPKLLENALGVASEYLVWYVASHAALTCHTARQRLAHLLHELAEGIGRRVPGGVTLALTNEELANASNLTLFTTSRLMAEWQRRGALTKSRGRVLLRHPERLIAAGQ